MRKTLLVTSLLFTALSFKSADRERVIEQTSFTTGEHIEYRVHYGFVNAALAKSRLALKSRK